MLEIGPLPMKTRQKASAVESSHNTMLSEEKTANNQLINLENNLKEYHIKAHDLETDHQHILNDIDGMIVATGDLKVKSESLRQKCQDQTNVRQQRVFEGQKISKAVQELEKEIYGMKSKIESILKDISKKEKDSQRLEEAISNQLAEKKSLEGQLSILNADEQREEENNIKLNQQLQHAMEQKESAFQAFVRMENITSEVLSEIKLALDDKNRKQLIHDQLSKKEHEIERQLAEVSIIRDRKAREMASMIKKTKEAKDRAKQSKLDIDELERKKSLIHQKLKEYSELYEKVKSDRNRYVKTIQTSRQLIVELKEKIRILDNEVEVLRKEFEIIDAEVYMKKNELSQTRNRRDTTKSELKKFHLKFENLKQNQEYQEMETKRLNKVLRTIEELLIQNQKLLSTQKSDHQMAQEHHIELDDSLSHLSERHNMLEMVMTEGEKMLKEQEEKVKVLHIALNDLQRKIEIMRRKKPQIIAYDDEIKDLKIQISNEKNIVDKITQKLELPEKEARPRAYCGKDFTMKELDEKVSIYEKRINEKGQQLWDKQTRLQEIDEQISELIKLVQSDSVKSETTLRKGGNLRAEAIALRRKKMAAYSEMALYAGQKSELEDEKKTLRESLEIAGNKTNRGENFDEYAEKIIKMHIRDQNNKEKNLLENSDDEDEKRPGRPRFDAYPTADGLSKPYGAFPAFQPSKPAGHLRHYKNETISISIS